MSDPYLGEIRLFGFNFAPDGWAFCQGQLLPIQGNEALFSLLSTIYGGDGKTNFALPDLRGRAPIGMGQGPGLSNIAQGQKSGTETVTLTQMQMPVHTHQVLASSSKISVAGTASNPSSSPSSSNSILGASGGGQGSATIWSDAMTNPVDATNTVNVSVTLGNAGGSQPVDIRTPYLGMNYAIAVQGIYPPRG